MASSGNDRPDPKFALSSPARYGGRSILHKPKAIQPQKTWPFSYPSLATLEVGPHPSESPAQESFQEDIRRPRSASLLTKSSFPSAKSPVCNKK
jgi:hypothetical protein